MKEYLYAWCDLFVAMALICMVSVAATVSVVSKIRNKLEVQHQCAHYDAQTGQFEWDDEVTTKEQH